MKTYALALAATLVTGALGPGAIAAVEPPLQRPVLCQDSWFYVNDDDVRMARVAGMTAM